MTGEIIISQGLLPEGVTPEDGVMAFRIQGDAELSGLERVALVYQLAMALSFGDPDWEALRMMADHEPPFDQIIHEDYQIGYTGWEDEDGG